MTQIVVGVDESEGAAGALRWAWREAGLRGWPVTAVLAFEQRDPDDGAGSAAAEAALEGLVAGVLGEEAAASVARRAVADLPAPALLDAAGPDDLLVVGARGLGGFRGLLLGSVSQHVVHHAPCPVVVVREGIEAPGAVTGARVVVGIDASETAARALQRAIEEAAARSATLVLVHAWQLPYVGAASAMATAFDPGILQDGAQQLVDDAAGRVAAAAPDVPVERSVVADDAAGALLDAAAGAELVVVGSRGIGGFGGLLLGSVSQKVARHAPCPVLVIPPAPAGGAS